MILSCCDAGLEPDAIKRSGQAGRSGAEVALAVAAGGHDAGLGIQAAAPRDWSSSPLHWERVDLVVRHAEFFEVPLQALFAFTRTNGFRERAALLGGYNVGRTAAWS